MKKFILIISIMGILLLIALLFIFFIPFQIAKEIDRQAIKVKVAIPNSLEYFIINSNGSEEKVVLVGNSPEKKISNGFFISNTLPLFGIYGKVNNNKIARNKITGEELKIIDVEDWFIVKPFRNLTLFDYYLPWEKKKDYISFYEILDK